MKVYIETYGCQMNEYDSRVMASILANDGHGMAHDPGTADVVMVNTCSVRERAEARVLGRLRHLRGLMKKEAVLGIAGCVAQRLGDRLLREVPGLSFVVGTEQYWKLPDMIESARIGRAVVAVGTGSGESYDRRPGPYEASLCEFVSVMRGCNNYCSYCIVPYVRGRERSRATSGIVDEVTELVALGTREVTLIGQNVNSFSDEGRGFAGLLGAVAEVEGLQRIRFATSHPKDLSDEVIGAIGSLAKICEHVHLPVQSGSTKVLANPRISVMNGQPAVIYVGDNVTYISEVETTTDEGVVTTAATTAQVISGLRLEVYATIMSDNEIVMSIIPMISQLEEPIEYRQFGLNQVGLPFVRERTMNTIVRLNNGEMLIVGGLISSVEVDEGSNVTGLGNLPGLKYIFGNKAETLVRKELVILLRPRII